MLKTIVPACLEFKDGVPYSADGDGGYSSMTPLNRSKKASAMKNLIAASNFLCAAIEITFGQVRHWR